MARPVDERSHNSWPLLGQLQGLSQLSLWLHRSGSAAGGTRTHKPLRAAAFEAASFTNFDTAAGGFIVVRDAGTSPVAKSGAAAFLRQFHSLFQGLWTERPPGR